MLREIEAAAQRRSASASGGGMSSLMAEISQGPGKSGLRAAAPRSMGNAELLQEIQNAGARRQGLTVIGVNATVVSVAPRAEDAAPVPGWVIGAAAGGASGLILLAMGRCAPPLCSAPLPIDTPLAQTLQNWLCSVGMVDH